MKRNFKTESLALSNILRRYHNSSDLELDDELSRKADEWAYELSRRGGLAHDLTVNDGENLYFHCSENGKGLTAQDPIYTWYVQLAQLLTFIFIVICSYVVEF